MRGQTIIWFCLSARLRWGWFDPRRLGSSLGDNLPSGAHLAHRAEVARLVGNRQLRRLDGLAVGNARIHGRVEHDAREQRSLDGIRRAALAEVRLDGMREGLEQAAIVPRANIVA